MKRGAALQFLATLAEKAPEHHLAILDAVVAVGSGLFASPLCTQEDADLLKVLTSEAHDLAISLRRAEAQQLKWQQVLTGGAQG
jgi:hypothetical protein